jgi:DNA transposition AAA+ family ATPase
VLGEMSLRPKATVGDMVDQIAQHLAILDVPLIIDEADHLVARRMIEIVRDIYEGSQAPVILIGEELLPQKLREWERVHGRMLDWVAAQAADLADLNHSPRSMPPG